MQTASIEGQNGTCTVDICLGKATVKVFVAAGGANPADWEIVSHWLALAEAPGEHLEYEESSEEGVTVYTCVIHPSSPLARLGEQLLQ